MQQPVVLAVQALFMFPIFMLGCICVGLCAAVLGARYIVRNLVRARRRSLSPACCTCPVNLVPRRPVTTAAACMQPGPLSRVLRSSCRAPCECIAAAVLVCGACFSSGADHLWCLRAAQGVVPLRFCLLHVPARPPPAAGRAAASGAAAAARCAAARPGRAACLGAALFGRSCTCPAQTYDPTPC